MAGPSNSDWVSQWHALTRAWADAWKGVAQGGASAATATAAGESGFERWARVFAPNREQGETLERTIEAARRQVAFMQSMLEGLTQAPGTTSWSDLLQRVPGAANVFAHPLAGSWQDLAGESRDWLARAMDGVNPFASAQPGQRAPFDLPAFGPLREYQERAAGKIKAWGDYREQLERYNRAMLEVAQKSFTRFESKLAEREQPGRQIDSLRALYDLWVDAAEEAWAEAALSAEFGAMFGELSDAQMRVRASMQDDVERMAAALGMPTRHEVDSLGRRLQELRRELRAGTGAPVARAGAAELAGLRAEIAELRRNFAAAGKPAATQASRTAASRGPSSASTPRKVAATKKAATKSVQVKPVASRPGAAGSFASRIRERAAGSLGAARSGTAGKTTEAGKRAASASTRKRKS